MKKRDRGDSIYVQKMYPNRNTNESFADKYKIGMVRRLQQYFRDPRLCGFPPMPFILPWLDNPLMYSTNMQQIRKTIWKRYRKQIKKKRKAKIHYLD